MRKYFLIVSLFGAAIIFLPQDARGQYTDPYYNSRVIGDMINRKTMENAARRNAKGKKSVVKKKKVVKKTPRKVSVFENPLVPKSKIDFEPVKRAEIV